MPTITVANAWNQRPRGILKTNEQGSRVKRIDRAENGRFTLYTENAPKGVKVAATFPLWYEGSVEMPAPPSAEPTPTLWQQFMHEVLTTDVGGIIELVPTSPAPPTPEAKPSGKGYAKRGAKSRDLVLTDKAIDQMDAAAGKPPRGPVVAVPLWLIEEKRSK